MEKIRLYSTRENGAIDSPVEVDVRVSEKT